MHITDDLSESWRPPDDLRYSVVALVLSLPQSVSLCTDPWPAAVPWHPSKGGPADAEQIIR